MDDDLFAKADLKNEGQLAIASNSLASLKFHGNRTLNLYMGLQSWQAGKRSNGMNQKMRDKYILTDE